MEEQGVVYEVTCSLAKEFEFYLEVMGSMEGI